MSSFSGCVHDHKSKKTQTLKIYITSMYLSTKKNLLSFNCLFLVGGEVVGWLFNFFYILFFFKKKMFNALSFHITLFHLQTNPVQFVLKYLWLLFSVTERQSKINSFINTC